MGENNGVIWILVAVIILGVAIFAMGSYFAGSAAKDQMKMAFTSESGVNQAMCEKNPSSKYTEYDASYTGDEFQVNGVAWTSGQPTGDCN
ncbi:MAG: hypothetical protein ACK5HR_05565 [Mycoplasmatales bacterium]